MNKQIIADKRVTRTYSLQQSGSTVSGATFQGNGWNLDSKYPYVIGLQIQVNNAAGNPGVRIGMDHGTLTLIEPTHKDNLVADSSVPHGDRVLLIPPFDHTTAELYPVTELTKDLNNGEKLEYEISFLCVKEKPENC